MSRVCEVRFDVVRTDAATNAVVLCTAVVFYPPL